MAPKVSNSGMNFGFGITYGNQLNFDNGNSIGVLGSLSYKNEQTVYENTQDNLYNFRITCTLQGEKGEKGEIKTIEEEESNGGSETTYFICKTYNSYIYIRSCLTKIYPCSECVNPTTQCEARLKILKCY